MAKRFYWIILILIAAFGLGAMIYFGIQPRPIPKIKLSRFESPTVLAQSLLMRLREEIKKSPVVFLGVDSQQPEHFQIWKEFLERNRELGSQYEVVFIDRYLETDLFPNAEKVVTKEDLAGFSELVTQKIQEGKRIAVIVPTIYSVQIIPENFVSHYKKLNQITPMSLSITDFPRSREDENSMAYPCIVEVVDQTGVGPFGCLIVQTARANYRKRHPAGSKLGIVNQIGLKDYIILYTQEK